MGPAMPQWAWFELGFGVGFAPLPTCWEEGEDAHLLRLALLPGNGGVGWIWVGLDWIGLGRFLVGFCGTPLPGSVAIAIVLEKERRNSYLVDPASSHMLVSKIKPCMCKYKLFCTVKLRMAH